MSISFVLRAAQLCTLMFVCLGICQAVAAEDEVPPKLVQRADLYEVGVAQVDITPDYPVRLNGFLVRKQESVGVRQPIWAKALAVGQGPQTAVLITVDALGIPEKITRTIGQRLQEKAGVDPQRLAITASHTHTAPMINGCAPNIFGEPIPAADQAHIDRYTQEFTDKLTQAALDALEARRPATLHFGIGLVSFAKNRRDKDGPYDHDLPLLVVRNQDQTIRAMYVSYACHCVTLSEPMIGGDWAGYAQAQIEKHHPGVIALASVGCAGDQNPSTGVMNDRADLALAQGEEIAAEVERLLATGLRPITGEVSVHHETLRLPLTPAPSREEFKKLAQDTGAVGYHARVQLAKLERGEQLPTSIDYRVQSWAFGQSLAMVFLPGEVVCEYGLRLKEELDGRKVWVNAYANACPGYIPSEKVLKAGGYEGGGAMIYYDQPSIFAPGLEQPIIDAVVQPLAARFPPQMEPGKGQGTRPRAAEQSVKLMRTRPELAVDLVAAEPLVTSPVAVDFGPDGKIWLAEMFDYPAGTDGTYGPAGRVRVLTSSDGQIVDTSTIFLDGIPFPTGITVWRKGVLVCAAPDILYAEDSDGDGRADIVKKLYSGFGTDNFQARVNSLEYGLDGWLYGSCGFFGGSIQSFAQDQPFELGNRDFRIRPDTGEIEPAAGPTQQGRVRDDFQNWFGCDNMDLARHYPIATHYAQRNGFAPPPPGPMHVPASADDDRLVPGNAEMQLFKLSGSSGIATAACGIGIYRDSLLGKALQGDLFTCEPVNLIVHRLKLSPNGSSFSGQRASDESQSEFLSSQDTWFRPVQVRTAPDGSLWVLDMYRFVIEHPRWIPPESLDQIDARAGANLGRIYRIRPRQAMQLSWPRLNQLNTAELVAALDSDNGWQRDMAMQLLVWNKSADASRPGDSQTHPDAAQPLRQLLRSTRRPETKVQVLATLDQRHELSVDDVRLALQDQHPGAVRHAVRLSEQFARSADAENLQAQLIKLATHEDGQVKLQVACSLGSWQTDAAAETLADMLLANPADDYLRSAISSSLTPNTIEAFTTRLTSSSSQALGQVASATLPLAVAMMSPDSANHLLKQVADLQCQSPSIWGFKALANMLARGERNEALAKSIASSSTPQSLRQAMQRAREIVHDESAEPTLRATAVGLLHRDKFDPMHSDQDLQLLASLLNPRNPAAIQSAAVAAMLRGSQTSVATSLLAVWGQLSPQLKTDALDGLLTRPQWIAILLDKVESKQVDVAEIDAARRAQLLSHQQTDLRQRAEKLLAGKLNNDRQQVLTSYATVEQLSGDAQRGAELFRKNCSTCHKLQDMGHTVGPDLAALAHKPVNFFLQEILDPNRNLDSRYLSYTALTDSGRTLTGLLAAETATAITLRGAEAKEEVLGRDELEELRSTRASLMPEGLEKLLPPQEMADVIRFVKANAPQEAPPETMASGELARDMLNEDLANDARLALVPLAVKAAPEVITAMAANLPRDENEEYRRIPWIWRVAVAAGKGGDTRLNKKVIEVAMPREGAELRDWQAVVIGGGVINGLGLRGDWPNEHIQKMLASDKKLAAKWETLLRQSQAMADNPKIRTGTRYDALRIIALAQWPAPKEQLLKYIGKDVDPELQMGSVSGLADVDHPEATALLIEHLPAYDKENRRLAVVALSRGSVRQRQLLKLIQSGQIKLEEVAPPERQLILNSKEADIVQQAKEIGF